MFTPYLRHPTDIRAGCHDLKMSYALINNEGYMDYEVNISCLLKESKSTLWDLVPMRRHLR